MGKVNCKCGNQISDVACPSYYKGWLLSDIGYDMLEECDDIIPSSIDVWECRDCGAIAFGNHKDNGIIWYHPEEKPTESLMDRATKKEHS